MGKLRAGSWAVELIRGGCVLQVEGSRYLRLGKWQR
jgi:hypothetical protein